MEEFGGYDASLSVVMGVHQSIGMKPIHLFGSDDQKARFLPDLTAGRKLAGFALTEPGAGSDIRAISSYAQRQADGSWVLNGEKRWIGNGGKDVVCVFARTDHGPVALIVEKGMPGFEAPDRYDTLGLRGNDLRRLTFRDVRVPKENMLGEPDDGLRIAMHTLNNGRMSLGTGVVGATKRLIRLAVEHTTTRSQFGRQLAEFELVEDKIAWMTSYLYGFESMAYLTTGLVDAGVPDYSIESAMAKIAGSEFHWYAVNRAFQLFGGQAYMADSPAAKALRDSRVFPIFEGSNDVLRSFVALAGLKPSPTKSRTCARSTWPTRSAASGCSPTTSANASGAVCGQTGSTPPIPPSPATATGSPSRSASCVPRPRSCCASTAATSRTSNASRNGSPTRPSTSTRRSPPFPAPPPCSTIKASRRPGRNATSPPPSATVRPHASPNNSTASTTTTTPRSTPSPDWPTTTAATPRGCPDAAAADHPLARQPTASRTDRAGRHDESHDSKRPQRSSSTRRFRSPSHPQPVAAINLERRSLRNLTAGTVPPIWRHR